MICNNNLTNSDPQRWNITTRFSFFKDFVVVILQWTIWAEWCDQVHCKSVQGAEFNPWILTPWHSHTNHQCTYVHNCDKKKSAEHGLKVFRTKPCSCGNIVRMFFLLTQNVGLLQERELHIFSVCVFTGSKIRPALGCRIPTSKRTPTILCSCTNTAGVWPINPHTRQLLPLPAPSSDNMSAS